jgi:serine acetyltransferase
VVATDVPAGATVISAPPRILLAEDRGRRGPDENEGAQD